MYYEYSAAQDQGLIRDKKNQTILCKIYLNIKKIPSS